MSIERKLIVSLSTLGWLAFAFAGLKGFSFWYGGFVTFLWIGLGAWNYKQKTTLWHLWHDTKKFLGFYLLLLVFWTFGDIAGQMSGLWWYPHYESVIDFLWVWAVLYPVAGFSMLELFYFVSRMFEEPVELRELPYTWQHRLAHYTETTLLVIVLGALVLFPILELTDLILVSSNIVAFSLIAMIAWSVAAMVRLKFHVEHWRYILLILLLSVVVTILLNEIPNTESFEWKYGNSPFLNIHLLGIPVWIFFVWNWWMLLHLRLWAKLILDAQ